MEESSFLAGWLASLQLTDYQTAFSIFTDAEMTSIDTIPPELSLKDLEELGVPNIKDRIKLRNAVKSLSPLSNSPACPVNSTNDVPSVF